MLTAHHLHISMVSVTVTASISQAVAEQLDEPELQGVKSVVMVGGFSDNFLVQVTSCWGVIFCLSNTGVSCCLFQFFTGV